MRTCGCVLLVCVLYIYIYVYIYSYLYVCVRTYVYMHVYVERKRVGERMTERSNDVNINSSSQTNRDSVVFDLQFNRDRAAAHGLFSYNLGSRSEERLLALRALG